MELDSAWCIIALVGWFLTLQCAATKCTAGDTTCFCKAVGGTWLATPTVVRPTCRKTVLYKGAQRLVDTYFPLGIKYSGSSYTPWIFLHGVHTAKWFLDDNETWEKLRTRWAVPLGGNAQADRLDVLTGGVTTANHSADSQNSSAAYFKDTNYILVVPHATGTPEEGQMWNSLFWPCMAAVPKCVNQSIDDVGLISSIINNMQQLLPGIPVKNKSILSGYSNGGMLAQALLCKQPNIANKLASVSIIASTLGEKFAANKCKSKLPSGVPIMWVHGTADKTLPYNKGVSENVTVLGAEAAVKHWASRMSCSARAITHPSTIHSDTNRGVVCKDFCNAALSMEEQKQQKAQQKQKEQKQERQPVVLCTAAGQPHQLVTTMPGYPAALIRWAAPAAASGRAFEGQPGLL